MKKRPWRQRGGGIAAAWRGSRRIKRAAARLRNQRSSGNACLARRNGWHLIIAKISARSGMAA